MPTNREYLDQLATESPDKLKAWFDAEHNDNLAAEKVVICDAAHSNDGNAHLKAHSKTEQMLSEQSALLSEELDSREKLEADIRASLGFTTKDVFAWLDRQAAITKRETFNHYRDELERRANREQKLQEQVDKLTEQRDRWRDNLSWRERNVSYSELASENDDLKAQVNRLTAERDNLADDLLACNREREQLRKHLGIALDHAHDICTLVDIDGNVLDVGD